MPLWRSPTSSLFPKLSEINTRSFPKFSYHPKISTPQLQSGHIVRLAPGFVKETVSRSTKVSSVKSSEPSE